MTQIIGFTEEQMQIIQQYRRDEAEYKRQIKVLREEKESETRWAKHYHDQWQDALSKIEAQRNELAFYRAEKEALTQALAAAHARIMQLETELAEAKMARMDEAFHAPICGVGETGSIRKITRGER